MFVLVMLTHGRRRIVHVAVIANLSVACDRATTPRGVPWDDAPHYLVHDRDAAFHGWATTATAMGIHEVVTAVRSPWQNAYAERLIGSIRRECLEHVIIANERGLRRVLHADIEYYLKSRAR